MFSGGKERFIRNKWVKITKEKKEETRWFVDKFEKPGFEYIKYIQIVTVERDPDSNHNLLLSLSLIIITIHWSLYNIELCLILPLHSEGFKTYFTKKDR